MRGAHPTFAMRTPRGSIVLLAGAVLATWLVVVLRMRGMDAGPGTDLGALGWYVGIWVSMMAAMMLPSATPMVLLHAKAASGAGRRPDVATLLFVTGYLVAWTTFGLLAWVLFRLVRTQDTSLLAWDRAGPVVAGAAVALAGLYQLTALKQACLRRCRTPLGFLMARWRHGSRGAVVMGVEHGAWCVGCCWGLMLALFAVGVMSITWMLVVAGIVFAEKVLPLGTRIATLAAVVLVAFGACVAVSPDRVPGLTRPGMASRSPAMPHMAPALP